MFTRTKVCLTVERQCNSLELTHQDLKGCRQLLFCLHFRMKLIPLKAKSIGRCMPSLVVLDLVWGSGPRRGSLQASHRTNGRIPCSKEADLGLEIPRENDEEHDWARGRARDFSARESGTCRPLRISSPTRSASVNLHFGSGGMGYSSNGEAEYRLTLLSSCCRAGALSETRGDQLVGGLRHELSSRFNP